MIDNIFKEQIRKNNVLDNNSNQVDFQYLSNFQGSQDFNLKVPFSSFGNISIKAQGVGISTEIKLNECTLVKITIDGEYCLPVKFNKESVITISGECKLLLIKINGAKFAYTYSHKILPLNSNIFMHYGNQALLSYTDINNVINNDLELLSTTTNVIFLQSYIIDGQVYLGKIINNNGVYFCNSLDNYTNKILICDEANSAIFLQDYQNSKVYFIYIRNYKIYYKVLSGDNIMSEESQLQSNMFRLPLAIIGTQTYINGSNIFAVMNDNGSIDVYYAKYNANFQKISEFMGKNIKIIEKDNQVMVLIFNDYRVDISTFEVNKSKDNGNMLTLLEKETVDNIINCDEMNDNLIFTSMGLYSWSRSESE